VDCLDVHLLLKSASPIREGHFTYLKLVALATAASIICCACTAQITGRWDGVLPNLFVLSMICTAEKQSGAKSQVRKHIRGIAQPDGSSSWVF
jgi:hypothetical protein